MKKTFYGMQEIVLKGFLLVKQTMWYNLQYAINPSREWKVREGSNPASRIPNIFIPVGLHCWTWYSYGKPYLIVGHIWTKHITYQIE